ncbi:MAG: divalent metal cation transporter [Chitinophagaceae bacterium]
MDNDNPAGSIFQSAAGQIGFKIFGVVLWSAAISSVIGASYTSVSFFKTFHPVFEKYERWFISLFIIITTIIFVLVGKPRELLILAGAVNGLILPIALAIILIAATKSV